MIHEVHYIIKAGFHSNIDLCFMWEDSCIIREATKDLNLHYSGYSCITKSLKANNYIFNIFWKYKINGQAARRKKTCPIVEASSEQPAPHTVFDYLHGNNTTVQVTKYRLRRRLVRIQVTRFASG